MRGGTWKPSGTSAWVAPLYPPCPAWPSLPIAKGRWDACKLQVTGQGAPKLVGALDDPEGLWCAGGVLGGLPAAPGGLWGQMRMQGCLGAVFCPLPAPPTPTPTPVPTFRAAVARSP